MAKKASKAAASFETEMAADPLWYKDAVIYQLHVRSFQDSNCDGIGDFPGLTARLDYLQDLGVTAVWLLPFYPSPLRDDGYDIADYTAVNPSYGDLRDFKNFIREAHARGLRVITELVINHTSDQHPWFQRARRAEPGSRERDFYVWSDTPERYADARIIFKDFEHSNWSWDPVAKAYYWHRFYAHQPDLNFENPYVQRAVFEAMDYWMRMGVDGVRLDAVPYLYEREGTNCENLPETHAFLKKLRRHVDQNFSDRMLLAEANQWPEDAIAYFGLGDECHTAFHFPVMPRLFMAIHMEDRFPIVDILEQTPPIPADCQWLIFLRNHDELTLEMVTDEERDYMYRVYARDRQARINLGIRRRLAPLLANSRRKIELMNALLFSLPGTPVIYYGDEIGMGDNIYLGDRNGVRTPMQWTPDRNAGFSDANPQQLFSPLILDSEYLYETVNVETQQKNPSSLLWWTKRLIALRQHYAALRRGNLEILTPENNKVLAFLRELDGHSVLAVANLSRFVQYVELDLSRFAGRRLIEMFGQSRFPTIGKTAYPLTLAPHTFFWFAVEAEAVASAGTSDEAPLAKLNLPSGWLGLTNGRAKKTLESLILCSLPARLGPTGRTIQSAQVYDVIALDRDARAPCLVLMRLDYLEGEPEGYLLPLALAPPPDDGHPGAHTAAAIAQLQDQSSQQTALIIDAAADAATANTLLETMVHRRRLKGLHAAVTGWSTAGLAELVASGGDLRPAPARPDRRDSTILFGDKLILTLFRRLETGIHPALEIGQFLARSDFPHALPLVGALEYRAGRDDTVTLGVLHRWVSHAVPAWKFASDALERFCEQTMAQPVGERPSLDTVAAQASLWDLASGDAPQSAKEHLGHSLEWASELGRQTGQLHLALAHDHGDVNFTPEPFSSFYQRSLYQSSRKLALQTIEQVRRRAADLPADAQPLATALLERERTLLEKLRTILSEKIVAQRIRCHGDYHLGHVLHTGKDFQIIDFFGEPTLPLSARRIKRSVVDDLAGMVHSFQYVASQTLHHLPMGGVSAPDAVAAWQQAASFWALWSSSAFLRSYAIAVGDSGLLPKTRSHWDLLLHFHLLAEAIYELRAAMAGNLEHTAVPLSRILAWIGA